MKAAIMGFGTIGSGVYEVLKVNRRVIERRVGSPIDVKYILDLREFEDPEIAPLIVRDYKEIAADPEVDMVVETMGGVEPAFTFVKTMLEAGKHVATSNKALVADKGAELIRIAREHAVSFLFEASVGGGIPVIRPLLECLTADVIEEITGIVNGTTNYMMTEMSANGTDFDEVLKEAQDKGFAEQDPTADIEGYDACRKIAILTSLIAGRQVDYQDIPTEGIRGISATDMKYAKILKRSIKLLATSRKVGDTYVARVAPYLLPASHPLSKVDGVFNAIFVHGNMLGDGMFYGSGAGKLPTASAVVGDLVEIARNLDKNLPIDWEPEALALGDPQETVERFFVRSSSAMSLIEDTFGPVNLIEAQKDGEHAFVTEPMSEKEFAAKTAAIDLISMIRMG